jgi:hypothetical protein
VASTGNPTSADDALFTDESLGNQNGISSGLILLPQNPTGDVIDLGSAGSYINNIGNLVSNQFPQAGSAISALVGSSSMSPIPGFSGSLASLSSLLGTNMGSFGGNLSSLAAGLTGSITAPVSSIGTSIGAVSQTLSSINTLLGKVGINTNIGNIATQLRNGAGQLAQASTISGIPGSLSSIGSAFTGLQGAFGSVASQITNIPGSTAKISSSITNMGNLFGNNGNAIANASSILFDL